MPCKDTTSKVVIRLDLEERLIDFDFSKITCSKEIGGGTGYLDFCAGRPIDEIADLEFNDLVGRLGLEDPEDQFFLYLEWDALRTGIAQYRGRLDVVDPDRYQIASITCDEVGIEISQVIRPLPDMPKIIPCSKRATLSPSPDQSG